MCLYTLKYSEIKRAEEDVVCYKIIKKEDNGEYSTPFMGFLVELNKVYDEPLFESHTMRNGSNCLVKDTITYGFHSLKSEEVRMRMGVYKHDYCIAKCIIPKGSLYVEGMSYFSLMVFVPNKGYLHLDFENMRSYASEKIIYKEIFD